MPADSFKEGVEGALAARGLEQEVAGALRVALTEIAPGLVAAKRGEEINVRRAELRERKQRVQRELAVQLRATSSSGGQRRYSRLRRVACRARAA